MTTPANDNASDNNFDADILELLSKPKVFAADNAKWKLDEGSDRFYRIKIPLNIEDEPDNRINKFLFLVGTANDVNLNLMLVYNEQHIERIGYKPKHKHPNPNNNEMPKELRSKRFDIGESRYYPWKYSRAVLGGKYSGAEKLELNPDNIEEAIKYFLSKNMLKETLSIPPKLPPQQGELFL